MKISKRLQTVADMVDPGSNIIDVGCDHAYLDIYVALKNLGNSIIASDNKEGPLESAKKNIAQYHLQDVIKVRQGHGLQTMDEDTDTVVISGMGGRTIIGLFQNGRQYFSQIKHIIVSINTDTPLVRQYLTNQGFKIIEERLVEDRNQIYPVLKWAKGSIHYSKKELYFGPLLLKHKDNLFNNYFERAKTQKMITLKLLPKKYWLRRYRLKREIKQITKELKPSS